LNSYTQKVDLILNFLISPNSGLFTSVIIGQRYYYNPLRRIITDSNIKQPAILQTLHRALAMLDMRLNAQNLILPPTTEVTLEVDIDQHPPVVRYYFVDHAQKTEFWLEKTSTNDLRCPPVTSYTHLSKDLLLMMMESFADDQSLIC
jgi:hypothetical protein